MFGDGIVHPPQGGGGTWNLHIQLQRKLRAQSSTPPKSSMFFPPSYVFLGRNHWLLAAVTSKRPLSLTVTINNNGGFSASTAPSPTFRGSPWFSMLIELVDWPGAMPTTHAPDIDLIITFRASCPGNISKCHTCQDIHKAKQQYTQLIETLTCGSVSLIQALSL